LLQRDYGADEDTLRAALTSKSSTERLAATYVVGERQLPWTADLIARITDSNPLVRQAARRSLVILSYFTIQAEKVDGSSTGDKSAGKPAIVDFGPNLADGKTARQKAAKNWQDWWNDHGGSAPSNVSALRAVRIEEEPDAKAARLSADLVFAPAERQAQLLDRYRQAKGIVYTEALANSLPQLDGEIRQMTRDSLAQRLSRMTAATLRDRLSDSRAELRRAAALAWSMKEDRAAIPELIPLLADPDDFVVRGVRAALRGLAGQDFGPAHDASITEGTAAIAAWKSWWQEQP